MPEKALNWLRIATVASFMLALCAGMFLPVYTDEIGWRFQERAGFDGVDKMFSDICGPNSLARPPFFMMPVRHFSASVNALFPAPIYVRISGVLYALLWAVMMLALLRRLTVDRDLRSTLQRIGFGLLAMGTLPLLLVWSRPEQPLILAALSALLTVIPKKARSNGTVSERSALWSVVLIVLLAIVAMSYHVKGVILALVFISCLFFAGDQRNARWFQFAGAVVIVAAALMSAHYWVDRLQCPGDPVLRAEYARNNLGLVISERGGVPAAVAAVGALLSNINLPDYFGLAAPRERPMAFWLEHHQITTSASRSWYEGLRLVWGATCVLAIATLFGPLRDSIQSRRIDPRAILSLALLGTALAWSATQIIRNVYEASFVLPLVVLAILLAISTARSAAWLTVLRASSVVIAVGGLASMVAIAAIYGPSLARANQAPGYVKRQPNSLSVFGYGAVAPRIMETARLCGLPEPKAARALMIDELTYFPYMQSRLPQHRLGVLSTWKGSITDPVAYLRSRGSSGAVLACHYLPRDLRARAKRNGEFCCLAPPNW